MPERSRSILETYNCLVRYKEILTILVKYGYKDLLMKINSSENKDLDEVLKDKSAEAPESVSTPAPRFANAPNPVTAPANVASFSVSMALAYWRTPPIVGPWKGG